MPYFSTDAELDISIDDFLYECDSQDIKDLINALIEEGHLTPKQVFNHKASGVTPLEQDYISMCNKLSDKFYQMSNEDIQVLETLYKKYC
jgi:hypothetical protein